MWDGPGGVGALGGGGGSGMHGEGPTQGWGGQGTRGAHVEHPLHGRDLLDVFRFDPQQRCLVLGRCTWRAHGFYHGKWPLAFRIALSFPAAGAGAIASAS